MADPVVKISATALQSWNLYRHEEWMTTERLILQLTTRVQPTPIMELGSAFHRALELAGKGEVSRKFVMAGDRLIVQYGGNGYQFAAREGADVRVYSGVGMEHEVKRRALLPENGVLLTGQADVVDTARQVIVDYKTSKTLREPEHYIDSLQWGAYLYIWDYDHFRFDCYQLVQDRRDRTLFGIADSAFYDVYRPEALRQAIEQECYEFAEFIRERGIAGKLKASDAEIKEAEQWLARE